MKIFKIIKFNGLKTIYFFNKKLFTLKSIKYVDKDKLNKKISQFNTLGVEIKQKTNPKIIVSLTSFPARINNLHYCIYSLLNQTKKPDILVLWLAPEEFPNKEKVLPQTLLNLKQNGLTIKWYKNIKSYKKLIPSLKEYPDDIIVTADDDVYYNKNWLKKLYNAYLIDKKSIHGHRAHQITFNTDGSIRPYIHWKKRVHKNTTNPFLTGVGGILYPPHSLYKDTTNETLFKKLSPLADDIWFWAMTLKKGTKINLIKNNLREQKKIGQENSICLYTENIGYSKNDEQLQNVLSFYKLKIKEGK